MGNKVSAVAGDMIAPILNAEGDLNDKVKLATQLVNTHPEMKQKLFAMAKKIGYDAMEDSHKAKKIRTAASAGIGALDALAVVQNPHLTEVDANTLFYIGFARAISILRNMNPGTITRAQFYYTNQQAEQLLKTFNGIPVPFLIADEDEVLWKPDPINEAKKSAAKTDEIIAKVSQLPFVEVYKQPDGSFGPHVFKNDHDVNNTRVEVFGSALPYHEVQWSYWQNLNTTTEIAWEGLGSCKSIS